MRHIFQVFARLAAIALTLGLVFASSVPAVAQSGTADADTQPPSPPKVTDARVLSTPDRARLVVDLTGPTQFAIAALGNPDRVVVDLKAEGIAKPEDKELADKGLIKSYTLKQAAAGRVRAELVLGAPAQVQQAYVLDAFADQPARLVVDFIPDTAARFSQRVKDDLAAAEARAGQEPAAQPSTPPGDSNVETASRPLIVIDPGHGGIDSGARSNGLMEKNITLAFAQDLQRLLVKTGRFDVALTRNDDHFLKLSDRVKLARENKADLFISIHADSFSDPSIRGASIYVKDQDATDHLDKILAENENKADLVAGFTPPDVDNKVVNILVDLMRRETRRQSYLAAKAIEQQFEPSVRLRRFPLRKANFFVLQAPDVPSILLELGFLSNASDRQNLETKDWQDRTAAALARGIAAYFDARDRQK